MTTSYRFLHDRVQQAAYAFIPERQKQQTHYHIGRFLLDHISKEKQEDHIFDIVNQLNIGRALISYHEELDQLIALNWRAGIKAKSATAYGAALNYFNIAIEILSADGWQQNYPMALKLHENAAEAAYLTGDGAHMEALVKTVTNHARNHLDTVKALQVKMQYCLAQNQPLVSIEIARCLLQELGIVLPEAPSMETVKQELEHFKQFSIQFSFNEIAALPTLTDPEKLAIVSTLVLVIPPTMIAEPNLFVLIVLAVNKLSLEYGNSPYSPFVYSTWAILLKNFEQDIDTAYEWGKLALQLTRTINFVVWGNRVCQSMGAFIIHWKRHAEESLDVFQYAYTSGLENGDFEFSAYTIFAKCYNLYLLGRELSVVKQTILKENEALSELGQNLPASWTQCCYRLIARLSTAKHDATLLGEDAFDTEAYVKSKQEQGDAFGLCYFHFNQATWLYMLGDYPQALAASKLAERYITGPAGMLMEAVFYFFDSLIHIACAQGPDDAKMLARVSGNQQKMKHWAEHAPMNFKHKYELVCAEERRLLGDRLAAMDYYDRAIEGAQANGYLQDQALANELAAKFYLNWGFDSAQPNGKEKIAAVYMQEAYLCYEQWGAKAKTDDLVAQYKSLLQPILQQINAIDPLATLHDIAPLDLSVYSSGRHVPSTGQSTVNTLNTTLDLVTIFKSAQALSESIDLTELLEKLTPMMLQTSGAERLALLLPNADNIWQIRVMATAETTQLVSDSLTDHPHLPVQLIYYSLRTQEIVEVDGLDLSLPVVDSYFQQYPCRSVLCLPLLHQRKFIGLLYLDHHSVAGLFSRDRITILNFLCTQAAISLENALLNQALEQKLEVQTAKCQESETRFRSMVNNVPGVVHQARSTPDGTISFSYVSPNCYALYGVSAEAFMSGEYRLRDFEHREDRPIIDRMVAEALQNTQPFDYEFRIVTLSGDLKWVHAINHPTHTLSDGSVIWDGIVMDVSDRKKLEQEQAQLNESLALKSSAIEASDVGIAILKDDKYIYLNESHLSILGYEEHELVGESWEKLYDPEEIERFKQQFFPVLAQHGRWLGEAPARRKDGSYFPQEVSLCALEDNQMICICRDISDRKHYEQQLQTLSNKLELAIESAQIGIWDWDSENDRLSWDARMFEIYGVRPEAFQESYQDWANRVHPEDLAQYEAGKRIRNQNNEKEYTQEFRIFRPDNTIRYILSTAFIERDEQGQPIRMVGTNLDITDRKMAELSLQQSEEKFRMLVSNLHGAVYRSQNDAAWTINYVSDAIIDLSGYPASDFIENNVRTFVSIIHPEDVDYVNESAAQATAKQESFLLEYRILHQDGSIRWVYEKGKGIFDQDNQFQHFEGVIFDISDRKQAEAELKRTNEELVRATRMKDEFLANMSHELRTPLNAILGMTEGLQDEVFGEINKQQLKSLTTIEHSGLHLLELINEILDLAKIEAGNIELEYSLVSVTDLCQSSLTFIRQQSLAKGVQLHLNIPWGLPAIQVDERRFRQVLINLLNNAVKFTPSGGNVTLKVALLPLDETYDQPHLSFAVSDTGIGIDPDQLNRLFQPFVQIDSALNRQYEGTGLGLALVKRIVELHGGEVTVTSKVGVGSCFTIELPYDTATQQGNSSPKAPSGT
ncbi:MAG: PAS domain-containing protein [Cyanobacteria bacterium P01_F01_bin.86]